MDTIIEEYEVEENGEVQVKKVEIKRSELEKEFPNGMPYDCERNADSDEYGFKDVELDDPLELLQHTEKEFGKAPKTDENYVKYAHYNEADLKITKSTDYEPVVVKAYCPKCGKEIVSKLPMLINPFNLVKICRYECECGWQAELEHQYPRLAVRDKNTGEDVNVFFN